MKKKKLKIVGIQMKMEASFSETKETQTKQSSKISYPSCWHGSHMGKKVSEEHWVREWSNNKMSVNFQAKRVISAIVAIDVLWIKLVICKICQRPGTQHFYLLSQLSALAWHTQFLMVCLWWSQLTLAPSDRGEASSSFLEKPPLEPPCYKNLAK